MPNLQVNLGQIKARLFEDRQVRRRLVQDYALPVEPETPEQLAEALIHGFGQVPVTDPLGQDIDNAGVFKAAVLALASNFRAWATFLRFRRQLSDLLDGYDPFKTSLNIRQGLLDVEQIKGCLLGQTSTADANAVTRWAELLTEVVDYYGHIRSLGEAFRTLHRDIYNQTLPDSDLLLCIVGFLGNPPQNSPIARFLTQGSRSLNPRRLKLPGMGYVLGSELMRNLKWNGFKPDRHIKRLLKHWVPQCIEAVSQRVFQLQVLIGTRNKELAKYLTYSLVGVRISPEGTTLSEVDNLIWALGAYVENKGNETSLPYVVERSA